MIVAFLVLVHFTLITVVFFLAQQYEMKKACYLLEGVKALEITKNNIVKAKLATDIPVSDQDLLCEYSERAFMHVAECLVYSHNKNVLNSDEFDSLFGTEIDHEVRNQISTKVKKDYKLVTAYVEKFNQKVGGNK